MRLEHVYGYAGMTNAANNLFYLQNHEVVYYTAAVGVVYSKDNWRANKPCQRFFFGHNNDIECLNVHPNRRFVVTGQQVRKHTPYASALLLQHGTHMVLYSASNLSNA